MNAKDRRHLAIGLAFLAPNILGVLCFTVIPLIFSIVLAFSNWDLRLHNMYKDEPLKFIGLDNFTRLFQEGDFYQFFGNTLFFMIGIPFAMAGSLLAAIMLSKDLGCKKKRTFVAIFASIALAFSLALLWMVGAGTSGMAILLVGIVAAVSLLGFSGGQTIYRTFFYTPHFTAGVATFILWKKLYNPNTGVINQSLQPVLDTASSVIIQTPPSLVHALGYLCMFAAVGIAWRSIWMRLKAWRDGDDGLGAMTILVLISFLPIFYASCFTEYFPLFYSVVIVLSFVFLFGFVKTQKPLDRVPSFKGMENNTIIQILWLVLQFFLLLMAPVFFQLPAMSQDGLNAPMWLVDYHWAKPAIMFMGLWGAIGSNNMLLYLAALTNVPQDLYEAAEIDGATKVQSFWNVTWPQLAPTTFFIFVMSVIGGLQGGMEMAKTMTNGGPAGSTTTLSYFIYKEGFETGRLGYASAISWALFFLVFSVTMVNWKFGNKKN